VISALVLRTGSTFVFKTLQAFTRKASVCIRASRESIAVV